MSAAEQPTLRVVTCEECERLRGTLQAHLEEIAERDTEITRLRRANATLRSQMRDKFREDPNHDVARELFEFWREQCGHDRASLGPGRLKPLLARLKEPPGGFAENRAREIAMAILGAKYDAFVSANGQRHDDLELICRTEVHLERNIKRYLARKAAS